MTLPWTVMTVCLYIEMGFLVLMMLPFIRPTVWNKIFKSRLVQYIERHSSIVYYSFGGILVLFFLDSIRQINKYGATELSVEDKYVTPQGDNKVNMHLFRAERNFFISGFTLFLYLVCKRMIQMLSAEARLFITAEFAMKKAEGDSTGAKSLLKEMKDDSEELKTLRQNVTDLKKELADAKSERDSMKDANEEYSRLLNKVDGLKNGHLQTDGKVLKAE